ncbi:MAG: hypothetical protein HYX68_01960 [Planctomycetes bacterium]|jgi:hypothetical protein|nr:hypothetical protein [Planctomycetota bacterium]
MEIYLFTRNIFAWSVTVAVLFPLTIPWAMLAYKIWHGNKEIEEEMGEELLSRSWRATLVLGVASPAFVFLDYLIVEQIGMPSGPTHVVFLLSFLAFAAWMMFFFFGMEDFFQGLMLSVIFLYLPTAVLFVLWLIIRWNPLFTFVLGWLSEPKV